MALHGNGEYVAGYHRGEFYLNHKLLKERELDPADVRDEAAAFLLRMTGVESAYTIDEIARGHAGANAEALRRNTDLHHSGTRPAAYPYGSTRRRNNRAGIHNGSLDGSAPHRHPRRRTPRCAYRRSPAAHTLAQCRRSAGFQGLTAALSSERGIQGKIQ